MHKDLTLMRTAIELGNSNCSWCLNNMLEDLRGRAVVEAVHLDASAGCLVVDHAGDPAALLARVHAVVRGSEVADNGESVMVGLDVREEPRCRWAKARPLLGPHQERSPRSGTAWLAVPPTCA